MSRRIDPMYGVCRMAEGGDGGGGDGGGDGGGGGGGDGGGDGGGGDWTAGLSDAGREIVTANGWKSADQVVLGFAEQQKRLGVPADQLLTLPGADADDAAWSEFHAKAGRPDAADGYTFEPLDGSTDELDATLREAAFKYDLTPRQAAQMRADAVANTAESEQATEDRVAAGETKIAEWMASEYGDEADAAKGLVEKALSWLTGGDAERLAKLERAGFTGDQDFVKKLRSFGELVAGDGKLLGGAGQGPGMNMFGSPAAAQAEISRLASNTEFMDDLHKNDRPGHAAAVSRYGQLMATAYPGEVNLNAA